MRSANIAISALTSAGEATSVGAGIVVGARATIVGAAVPITLRPIATMPNTMIARFVSTIDVASVAMSWTCHVRSRMARMTVRWYAIHRATCPQNR